MKGQQQAVKAFVDDIKNLPNVPQELYQALKDDPTGTAKAILSALVAIPGEIWDTGKTVASVNIAGDTLTEFEQLGKSEMSVALSALTAGSVKVVTKGGKVGFEAVKNLKNTYILAKTPEGIHFQIKQPTHLATVDGFTQKSGISGGHNATAFHNAVDQYNIKVVSETPTSVVGISNIKYQIPAFDRAGNVIGYKAEVKTKTIYDPKIFTDQKMLDLGQKAAVKGYKDAMASKNGQATTIVDGVNFRIYVDKTTGEVRNFHPN